MKIFEKKKIIIGVIIGLLALGTIVYFAIGDNNLKEESSVKDDLLIVQETTEEKESEKIKVEIKGEVATPGVYELNTSSRIENLVKAAGGFTKNAYYDNVNLSMKLKDEMVVIIYNKTSIKKTSTNATKTNKTNEINKECETKDYNISECLETKESVIVKSESVKDTNASSDNKSSEVKENTSSIININTASIKELSSLTGIGEAKAQKIIDYREANGGFKSIDEIMNVKGIGKATYEKFKANITI